jgi:hypothetical protein
VRYVKFLDLTGIPLTAAGTRFDCSSRRHAVDFVDAQRAPVVHADGPIAEQVRHVLHRPFADTDIAYDAIAQLFCFPPFGRARTERRDRLSHSRLMEGEGELPERPPAGIAESLHPDVASEPGRDQPFGHPEKLGGDLALWIEHRISECDDGLLMHERNLVVSGSVVCYQFAGVHHTDKSNYLIRQENISDTY